MAQNPLLGNRISLISKKNIRYEGTLYSINETNATVALQNVRSYGTEGREESDPATTFVAPQDAVHPYLLFRGCDIKDLHVHEKAAAKPADDPAVVSNSAPPDAEEESLPPPPQQPTTAAPTSVPDESKKNGKENETQPQPSQQQRQKPQNKGGRGAPNIRRPRKANPANQVGTGASLLNRKARGSVEGGPEINDDEFDFQSKLEEFNKDDEGEEEDAGDSPDVGGAYEKDDFFDSISCDALDRKSGVDNRLRGAQERNLNTETFGAVALNSQRRRRRGGGGPGRGGRGRGGRGRGRGRGRGGRGRGRSNGRGWGFDNNPPPQAASS